MLRYLTAAVLAALLLAVALRARQPESDAAGATVPAQESPLFSARPEISLTKVPGGMDLKLKHRFAGSISRASLVYEYGGDDRTLDKTTNCQRSLDRASGLKNDGYDSEVELSGRLPQGYTSLRLVLEDETGKHTLPVKLEAD